MKPVSAPVRVSFVSVRANHDCIAKLLERMKWTQHIRNELEFESFINGTAYHLAEASISRRDFEELMLAWLPEAKQITFGVSSTEGELTSRREKLRAVFERCPPEASFEGLLDEIVAEFFLGQEPVEIHGPSMLGCAVIGAKPDPALQIVPSDLVPCPVDFLLENICNTLIQQLSAEHRLSHADRNGRSLQHYWTLQRMLRRRLRSSLGREVKEEEYQVLETGERKLNDVLVSRMQQDMSSPYFDRGQPEKLIEELVDQVRALSHAHRFPVLVQAANESWARWLSGN